MEKDQAEPPVKQNNEKQIAIVDEEER